MMRLGELSELVNGTLTGDANTPVHGAASISRARSTEITFLTTGRHLDRLLTSHAVAVVVPRSLEPEILAQIRRPVIRVDNPEACFARMVVEFRPPVKRIRPGVSAEAYVSPSAKIAEDVDIYPGAYIGDGVVIGPGCVIYPHVTILDRCQIGANVQIFPSAVLYSDTVVGERVIIHAAVVLGAYGFGYKTSDGRHLLSSQLGNVVIGADVEIGAGSTIDRGTYDSTIIGEGTKIDDQVMIGHNCQVGEHNLLCSQVGIAGSSNTGNLVTMAGQVGVGDHVNIADKVILHAKCGIMSDVGEGEQMLGAPANPIRKQMQVLAVSNRLPEMRRQMKEMTKTIKKMQEQMAAMSTDVPVEAGVETKSEVVPVPASVIDTPVTTMSAPRSDAA